MSRRFAALVVMTALAFAPALAHADSAQQHYSTGRESYRAGLYGRALEEFERSYAATPSPNTHLYIARSLRELGRWTEAQEHYRQTIREAEERGAKYAAAREAAETELRDVEVRIERAEAKPTSEAVATAPPPPAARVEAPSTEPRHGPSTVTWASGGVALVGLASFGVLYGLASDRYAYLEDHCTRTRDAACDDARTTGRTQEGAAYVALGVGVVAAAVTVISLVVAPSDDAKRKGARPWLVAF